MCGTVASRVECIEDFFKTALGALSSPVGENCVNARDNARRISLTRSLTQPTGIQLPATSTAVRHSIASKNGQGILTLCPSGAALAIPLGPTNPQLITIAEETLIFRRAGFSPALWLLVPAFSLPYAPAWVTPLPSSQTERSPTACNPAKDHTPAVSALCLTPIIFGAGTLDE